MRAYDLISPHFTEGLWKRKWLHLLIIGTSLALLGGWYLNLPVQKACEDGQNPTFEMLSAQINHEDSIFSNTWRNAWPSIPKIIQERIQKLTPSPPAAQVRLGACTLLHQFGKKTFPLVFPKLKDSDSRMVVAALHSLMVIKVSNDQTFQSISAMVTNKNFTLPHRRIALLTLIGLHKDETRLMEFLAEAGPSKSALFDSLAPEVVDPLSSFSRGGLFLHQETMCVSRLRRTLSHEYLTSLIERDEPAILKLFFYLFHRTLNNWTALKPRLLILTLHADETIREQAYLSLIQLYRRGQAMRNDDHIMPKNDHPMFQSAANDPSPIVRRHAHRFLVFNFDPNPITTENLFKLAGEEDAEISHPALVVLGRSQVKPSPDQLSILFQISSKQNGPMLNLQLCNIFAKWSLVNHPEVTTILTNWADSTHPALKQTVTELLMAASESSDETMEDSLLRIQAIHDEAQTLSEKLLEYQKASTPGNALPVSWLARLNKVTQQRRRLFSLHYEVLKNDKQFILILNQSVEDPFNPNQMDDALIRWHIEHDASKILPMIKQAIMQDSTHDHAFNTARTLGLDAIEAFEILLDHEDEKFRIKGLQTICDLIKDSDKMKPYFDTAAKDPSNMVQYAAKRLGVYYSLPVEKRSYRLNLGL